MTTRAGLQGGLSQWARVAAALCIGLGLLTSVGWVAQAGAEDSQVTIGVGDTILSVSGLTSPGAFVAIMDNHNVIGTTTADPYGSYTKDFFAFAPGIHHLSAYGRDTSGRLTDTVELEVSVAEHARTNVSIFLAPTFTITNATVNRGEHVQLVGSTVVNGNITITLDDTITFQTQANAQGDWSYNLDTTALSAGSHSLYVIATEMSSGRQSYPTTKHTITVKTEPALPLPGVTPPGQRPPPITAVPPPPIITSPAPDSTITDSQVVIRGTALPGTQIELFNRGRSIGSTFTDAQGNWHISITLTDSEYSIEARACRRTLCSEFSERLRLFHRPPPGLGGFTARLEQFRYITPVGEPIALRLHIEGGKRPYRITITWCDDRQTVRSTTQSELTLSHTYRKTGQCIGRITIEEQTGRSVRLDFTALVVGGIPSPWLCLLLLLLSFLLALLLIRRYQRKYRRENDQTN